MAQVLIRFPSLRFHVRRKNSSGIRERVSLQTFGVKLSTTICKVFSRFFYYGNKFFACVRIRRFIAGLSHTRLSQYVTICHARLTCAYERVRQKKIAIRLDKVRDPGYLSHRTCVSDRVCFFTKFYLTGAGVCVRLIIGFSIFSDVSYCGNRARVNVCTGDPGCKKLVNGA